MCSFLTKGLYQPRFYKALPAVIAATLCDATLIILAVMGVSVLILTVGYFKYILLLIGIIFLIYMGIVTWRSQDDGNGTNPDRMTAKKQVLFACSVSLLNPHAILDTIGVIGASSIQYHGSDKFWFTFAGILVSLLWFITLAIAGGLLKKLKSGVIPVFNKISALIIWGSAIYLVINFL